MAASEAPRDPGGMGIALEEGAEFAAENEVWHQENARRARQPNQPPRTRRRVPSMRLRYIVEDIRRVFFETRWPGFAFHADVPGLNFQMLFNICYVVNYHHLNRELDLDELVRHYMASAIRHVNQHRHFNQEYRVGNEDTRRIFDDIATEFFDNVADQEVPGRPEGTVMIKFGFTGPTLMRIVKRMGNARALYLRELERKTGPAHVATQCWTGEGDETVPVARGPHGELLGEVDRWNYYLKVRARSAALRRCALRGRSTPFRSPSAPDHVALSNLEIVDAE